MALFQREKTEEKKEPTVAKGASSLMRERPAGYADILRNPRITEKASDESARGVYTFDVAENATKRSVATAVAAIYKVSPRKVRIVPVPAKVRRSVRTGARGVSRGGKKAYVYLKKGDTITLT